jgi:hypothetical protein
VAPYIGITESGSAPWNQGLAIATAVRDKENHYPDVLVNPDMDPEGFHYPDPQTQQNPDKKKH